MVQKINAYQNGGWYEELGRVTLTSAGDTLSVASLPARNYLKFVTNIIPSGNVIPQLKINNDGAANYGHRYTIDNTVGAGSDATSNIGNFSGSGTFNLFISAELTNFTSQAKLGMARGISGGNNTTRPTYVEFYIKWNNTSAQINRIDIINIDTGDFAIGSSLIVLGAN